MKFKKTLLAVTILASSVLLIPPASFAEQDKPGVLSPASQKYFKNVIDVNKKAWLSRPHKHASSGHLVTTVCVQVDRTGAATCSIFEKSGDNQFDQFALQVCKETSLPAPPESWNPDTRIGVVFSSRVKNAATQEKYRDTNFVDTVKTATSIRWAATALPSEFKGKSLVAIISSTVSEQGKAAFELKTSSGNEDYDRFVIDLCKKTFIPVPPAYWDNAETVELMYSSKDAGSSLK
ncbi:MAG: TonB C-terminal domain-containing protein [Candidatus Melainabacteria bacterium]|nr:TonB C-terminal domain-containing protein [Candidatus Melainabacteria bacterium]